MCRVVGPQPFGLPVSDANRHHSYRSLEEEGQAGLHFLTQRVHEGWLRQYHRTSPLSMLRSSSSQEARSETEGVTEGWT
ncbi:hypothetical protein E2C01_093416 [Portunus trituberculatus]|uniref:Uncharacterized protein n=1 Tax=Portunus trituberculatus TaxID=210409 RepID=A0A5B7JUQ8_PORTR|nr:hypothetical protein [Portunus trituberculatus]